MNPVFGAILAATVALVGCSAPRLNANIGIGPGGVTLTPAVSARVGAANITVSP